MNNVTLQAKKRMIAILLAITFAFVVMLGRIFWVQFIQGPELQKKAMEQWVRDLTVAPERGKIKDRNGNVLAKTVSADTVLLRPQEIKTAGNVDQVVSELSRILGMDESEVRDRATRNKSEVQLKRQISSEQAKEIKNLNLSGVVFTVDAKRQYTYGDFLSQTLGITTVDGVGQSGLEAVYDKYLTGEAGKITTETDKDGRQLPDAQEEVVAPVDGYDLTLTVDYAIQSFLEKALSDAVTANNANWASGIVMNPNTGEIMAISTKPGYDLNQPPRDNTDQLSALSRNKIFTDAYELGSIMKTITLCATLEESTYDENSTFTCTGSKVVDGESIKCHATVPHGTITLKQALQKSCNPAFMEQGLTLGKETYYKYLDAFGFNSKTGINFPGEGSSILMHIKYVKDRDLARIAFGQSAAVTPLQFVTAFSSMVNGGSLLKPYLVKEIVSQEGDVVEKSETQVVRNVISEQTSNRVAKLLYSVVSEKDGSGKNAYIPGYRVGGKTGTAQKYGEDGKIAQGKYITSFVGVAPADDPQLVCLIMVDEPKVGLLYGSTVAAPVVKVVLEDSLKYLNVPAKFQEGEENEKVKVPNIVGMSYESAKAELGKYGLQTTLVGSSGTITRQFPAADASVFKGSYVLVYPENTSGGENAPGQE